MKTKNNVQKAFLRSGAVIISFVLISFTVRAQEFWKKLLTNSSFNEIAIAMVENSEMDKKPAESKTESNFDMEEEKEENLSLENWMTNDFIFGISDFQIEEESEISLELEEWMIDNNFFSNNLKVEQELTLESWMISEELWNS
jgi:hypothetical protein